MQLMITHGRWARTRTVQLSPWLLGLLLAVLAAALMLVSGTVYHLVFLKAAREGWPLVSPIVRLVVRDEIAQRDRFMRDNLDAMASKVGEIQAKLVRLEAMSDRVGGLAGLKVNELRPPDAAPRAAGPGAAGSQAVDGGKGGRYLPAGPYTLEELLRRIDSLDQSADWQQDVFTYSESTLMRQRLDALRVPGTRPVDGPVGSGFGFRTDPITQRRALHTGLDFPSDAGTPIAASAAGMVVSTDWHAEYGHTVEIDHGNGLLTRYAHCLRVLVKPGQIVRPGQTIGEVGSSGRSTGPHLHFEVLVDGVPHDPARFLARAAAQPLPSATPAAALATIPAALRR